MSGLCSSPLTLPSHCWNHWVSSCVLLCRFTSLLRCVPRSAGRSLWVSVTPSSISPPVPKFPGSFRNCFLFDPLGESLHYQLASLLTFQKICWLIYTHEHFRVCCLLPVQTCLMGWAKLENILFGFSSVEGEWGVKVGEGLYYNLRRLNWLNSNWSDFLCVYGSWLFGRVGGRLNYNPGKACHFPAQHDLIWGLWNDACPTKDPVPCEHLYSCLKTQFVPVVFCAASPPAYSNHADYGMFMSCSPSKSRFVMSLLSSSATPQMWIRAE